MNGSDWKLHFVARQRLIYQLFINTAVKKVPYSIIILQFQFMEVSVAEAAAAVSPLGAAVGEEA